MLVMDRIIWFPLKGGKLEKLCVEKKEWKMQTVEGIFANNCCVF